MFPLYGWDLSFKATGLLETSSLLLNNNFQGIFITYLWVSQVLMAKSAIVQIEELWLNLLLGVHERSLSWT